MKRVLVLAWLASAAAAAHPGVGIVVDSRGNVFYTDLKQVWRLYPGGRAEVAVPDVHSHELSLDAADNLYGEHLWYEGDKTGKWGHYVWKRSPNGVVEKVIPPTEGFLSGYSFVRDGAGNMYWAERLKQSTRIRQRTPQGIRTLVEAPFRDVRQLAASPAGVVYLVDYQDLVRISPHGQVEVVARGLARNSPPNNHAVMGLSPDAAGNVYLAVHADGEVKKVSRTGVVTTVLRSPDVVGVFAGVPGVLWILESGASGVRARKVAL